MSLSAAEIPPAVAGTLLAFAGIPATIDLSDSQ